MLIRNNIIRLKGIIVNISYNKAYVNSYNLNVIIKAK